MSIRSFLLSSVSALLVLAVGCSAPREAAQSGTLAVTVAAGTSRTSNGMREGSVSITGLDRPFDTRVALPSAGRPSLELSLPPGLYGVQWKRQALSAPESDLPAESAVSLVVVAAGGTSSVVLRATGARETSAAQRFASAETFDARLASR
jgi:hypothetical protein